MNCLSLMMSAPANSAHPVDPSRRRLLHLGLSGAWSASMPWAGPVAAQTTTAADPQAPKPKQSQSPAPYANVTPGQALQFPRDHGAHPDFRTEWWYLTGWLRSPDAPEPDREIGFQLTFFRSRPPIAALNSRYAPTQLLLAHAALALPSHQKLVHAQASARWWAEHPRLRLSTADTDLALDGWRLQRLAASTPTEPAAEHYRIQLTTETLNLDLKIRAQQAQAAAPKLWLQGERGYSRKGPQPEQASWYYSRPQLTVSGRWQVMNAANTVDEQRHRASRAKPRRDHANGHQVTEGTAWLDHEWASSVLDRRAAGWDWVGLNLDDGQALMAFQIRQRSGLVVAAPTNTSSYAPATPASTTPSPALWQTVSWWPQPSRGDALRFEPRRWWTSPRTGVRYPVAQTLHVQRAGQWLALQLEPLFDDQELDGRRSTGILYWEGAVRVFQGEGSERRPIGRGYLELTGYHAPLRL